MISPQFVRASFLEAVTEIRHGFFTREQGHSTGLYAGLNCGLGSQDDPAAVSANRRAVAAVLGCPNHPLLTVHQVHSALAVSVDAPFAGSPPQADALVTTIPGLVIGALAADCAPVLFGTRDGRVVAAAHAGWKGAFGGIVEATVAAMERAGARRDNIVAAVGPCIAQNSYEVGAEFRDRLMAEEATTAAFFIPAAREGHFQFDLPGFVLHRLHRSGIGHAEALGLDTYTDESRFYSYRRATHRGDPDYGRQVSAIVIGPRGQD